MVGINLHRADAYAPRLVVTAMCNAWTPLSIRNKDKIPHCPGKSYFTNFTVERLFCATIHLELRIMMMLIITMVTMMNSNLPGLFLHSSHNPQRLRPGSAHFHLTYRINHFPHCNSKSAHKLKCLQYDLRKALAPPWLHVFSMKDC